MRPLARRLSSWGACASVVLVLAGAPGCGFDFDAPFAETGRASANGDGGPAGSGGSSGSAGTSADAGGTGGTSGSAGASGSSTGGTGGVEAGTETCDNGVDDDGDGQIDCADPDCGAYVCTAPAPAGWQGPVLALLTPGGGGAKVDCPAAWQTRIAGGMDPFGEQASCSPCLCSAPHDGTCGLPTVDLFDPSTCEPGSQKAVFSPMIPNACEVIIGGNGTDSAIGSAIPVIGGTCDPAGGSPSLPPASWSIDFVACAGAPSGGGCDGAALCVRRPTEDFASAHCVLRVGDYECPTGDYPVRYTVYASTDDTRGCTPCACGTPTGQSCGGTSYLYGEDSCASAAESPVVHDGATCASVSGARSGRYVPDGNGPVGGACPSMGGESTGLVSPKDPLTLCCPAE